GRTRPALSQAATPRIGTRGYMQKRCSQHRWQGGKWATSEKYRLPAVQTVATTAARASAWGATAATAWRPRRRRAGENRPPAARTTAVAVATSATTASRASHSETVCVSTPPRLSPECRTDDGSEGSDGRDPDVGEVRASGRRGPGRRGPPGRRRTTRRGRRPPQGCRRWPAPPRRRGPA